MKKYIIYKIYYKYNEHINFINYIYKLSNTINLNYILKQELNNIDIKSYCDILGKNNFKIQIIKELIVLDNIHIKAYVQLYLNKYKSLNKKKVLNI